jgi:hypothetical protein
MSTGMSGNVDATFPIQPSHNDEYPEAGRVSQISDAQYASTRAPLVACHHS